MRYYIFEGRNHVWACRSTCKEAEKLAESSASQNGATKGKTATVNQVATSQSRFTPGVTSETVICFHCAGNHFRNDCPVMKAGEPMTEQAKANRKAYYDALSSAPAAGDDSTGESDGVQHESGGDLDDTQTPTKTVSYLEELSSDDESWQQSSVYAVRTGGGGFRYERATSRNYKCERQCRKE
jgi:hypothetical protein